MNTVQLEQNAMKFILDGRTFDTATSTVVALERGHRLPDYDSSVGDCETRWESVVYRTARGALFMHSHVTKKYVKGGKPVVEDTAFTMTPEEALEWTIDNCATIINGEGLPLPPEA